MSTVDAQKNPYSQVLVSSLKYLLAAGVLYWFWHSDRIDLKVLIKILDPLYGPIVFFMVFIAVFLTFYRLFLLLKSNNVHVPMSTIFKTSLIGLFYNFTLPGGAGGDFVKIYYLLQNRGSEKAKIIGLVVADRIIGVFGILLMAFVALMIRPEVLMAQRDLQILFLSLLGVICGLIFFVIMLNKIKIDANKEFRFWKFNLPAEKVVRFQEAARFIVHPKNLGPTFSLTVVSQSFTVLAMYFAGRFIFRDHPEISVELLPFFIVVPLGLLTTAIPISPGGIGVGQMAFYALFKIYTDRASELGPTIVTVYQIVIFSLGVIGLILFLRWKKPIPHT